MKKKTLFKILVSLIFLILLGCSGNKENSEKTFTLKVGTVLNEADPIYKGLETFKKNVEEKTGGHVKVELYSGGQLGTDEDVLEQAKVGAGVGIITDPGRMSNYIRDFGVLAGPYLVDNYEQSLKLMDTSVYKDLVEEFSTHGFKILSFNYFQGSRNLYTKNPISSPSDLKGQRIRSSGSEIVTKSLEAMGANTTVIPWSEAYQALQQKVIEGVEVHNSAAVGSSIYEVTSYVSLTGHFQLLTGLVISDSWFSGLPDEYKKILIEESFNAGKQASEEVIAKDNEFLSKVKESGVKVVDVDREAFKNASQSVYETLGYKDLYEKIEQELK